MLVLSRRKDQRVIIDGHIEISIVDIKGDQVKLGIIAPPEIKVHRHEVFVAIQAENKAALTSPVNLPNLKITKND